VFDVPYHEFVDPGTALARAYLASHSATVPFAVPIYLLHFMVPDQSWTPRQINSLSKRQSYRSTNVAMAIRLRRHSERFVHQYE